MTRNCQNIRPRLLLIILTRRTSAQPILDHLRGNSRSQRRRAVRHVPLAVALHHSLPNIFALAARYCSRQDSGVEEKGPAKGQRAAPGLSQTQHTISRKLRSTREPPEHESLGFFIPHPASSGRRRGLRYMHLGNTPSYRTLVHCCCSQTVRTVETTSHRK